MITLLVPAIDARLHGDTWLRDNADVFFRRRPASPERLTRPGVIIEFPNLPDETGLHGGAQNFSVEIRIWGYGYEMDDEVAAVADRVTLLMCAPFELEDGSATTQLFSELGWHELPEAKDPKIIHLLDRFGARFWSATKISTLTTT